MIAVASHIDYTAAYAQATLRAHRYTPDTLDPTQELADGRDR